MNNIVKTCKKCGPLSVEQVWKDGTHLRCKECAKARARKQYEKHREKRLASRKIHTDKNRDRINEQARAWRANNKERLKEQHAIGYKGRPYTKHFGTLMRSYGINWEIYQDLLKAQNNLCAICNCPETQKHAKNEAEISRLVIDHCHEQNIVRGLLCHACNTALGKFKDDIALHDKAIRYLQKHEVAA